MHARVVLEYARPRAHPAAPSAGPRPAGAGRGRRDAHGRGGGARARTGRDTRPGRGRDPSGADGRGSATTGHDLGQGITAEAEAEFFAGARLDLGYNDSLDHARAWVPDLVVAEMWDCVGPMVAAALGVPTAVVGIGPAMSEVSAAEFRTRVALRYEASGVEPRPLSWYLDTCPPTLQRKEWERPAGLRGLRTEAHRSAEGMSRPVVPPGGRPRVLMSFGTLYSAPELVDPLIGAVLALDVDLRVTLGLTSQASDYTSRGDRVQFASFTPLAELLSGVDAVVTHGGSGTVLGTLAAGLPMVVVPQGADQHINAELVADRGLGIAFPLGPVPPRAVADALGEVLAAPEYRAAATRTAEEIKRTPSPREVAAMLAEAVGAP